MKKITKILSLFFVAAVAFTLAACGAKTEAPQTKAPVQTTTKAPVVTTKAPVVTTKAPEVTTAAPHTVHDYSGEYKHDEDGHWKECTVCGNKSEVEEHEFSVEEVRPTLETEGSKTYTCDVCGYTYTENTGLAKVWAVGDDSYLLDYTSKQTDPHFTTIEYSEDGKTIHLVASSDYSWNAIIAYCSGTTEGYALEITVTTPATATKAANYCIKPNDSMEKWCSAPVGESKTYTYYGATIPAEMATFVVMAASGDMDGYLSIRWFEMKPQLVDPSLYILGNGYYNSTDATRYNQFIEGDTTANNFIGTRFFTKEMLPVGSIIEIAEGYKYRPEGWKDENKQTSRENNVTEARVVVTEEWWGDYVKRAFNIANSAQTAINTPETYAAAVAAFKIYVPYGTVIKPMERVFKDVDVLKNYPTQTNAHEVSYLLTVIKNSGTGYEWVALDLPNDLTGYDTVVATVKGTADEAIIFKASDNSKAEKKFTMDGTVQELTYTFTEGFEWNTAKKDMIIMPNPGVASNQNPFFIYKLQLTGEGKDPIDLLAGTVTKAAQCDAQRALIITKPTTVTNEWDTVWLKVDDDLTDYQAIKYTVQGKAGEQIMFKINDTKEVWFDLDGTVQTGYFDVSEMTFDPNKLTMVLFANPGKAGTGNPITIYELTYVGVGPKSVTPTATAVDGALNGICTFSDDKMTATITDASKKGTWARWDYKLEGCDAYTTVTVVLKGTPGLGLTVKLDTAGDSPLGNNYFDGMTGNKTSQTFGEDGYLTFTWDLSIFAAKCTAAGKVFDVNYLSKLVFFLGDSTAATVTVELVSYTLTK